ncbi:MULTISPECIES: hypothetical protein [Pseudanabaena]|uniref:hypothetical protein n=1 Tax=Pseudanabaena TaxID=1152 RepID=UPI00247A50E7|nr:MULTISPECIES: hypothetical protein [Pseudanabaena]MEA5485642.1 hypothetical protein [Pseudanabaena sp. CCNP1317]WGS71986.1 hypothetical protein OA858_20120 [Pseudanabaena galeata CCNP1313]
MRTYQPSNIAPSQGVTILAISSLVSGAAIGGATAFISKFIYFIVLFPMVMGFASGAAMGFAVKKGKIRNPLTAISLGVLGGLVTYGSLMYGQYINFQQETETIMEREYNVTDKNQAKEQINNFLQQETGSSGFVGFLKMSAKEGTSISRGSSKVKLNDTFTYLLWLIELGIVGFLAASIPFKSANEPFNEEANEWYGEKQWVGSATAESKDELMRLLNMDDMAGASALLSSQTDLPTPRIDVYSQSCAGIPFSDSVITVSYVSTNAKKQNESKDLLTGLVSESQRSLLVPQISTATSETPPEA